MRTRPFATFWLALTLACAGCPDSKTGAAPTPTPSPAAKTQKSVVKTKATRKTEAPPKPEKPERWTKRRYTAKVRLSGPGLAQQTTDTVDVVREAAGSGERMAVGVESGGLELALDAQGELTRISDEPLRLLIQGLIETKGLKQRSAPRNVYLPDGGWIQQIHQVSEEPETLNFEDRACEGTVVSGKFKGERGSGEAFNGEVWLQLWRDQETAELLAIKAKLKLVFRDHGPRLFKLQLVPNGEPEKSPASMGPWVKDLMPTAIGRELAMPILGVLLQASAVGTAAKVSPRLWGPTAVIVGALGSLAARSQSLQTLPDSGKVIALRKEPARTFVTLVPTVEGRGLEFVPTIVSDGVDHVVTIESTKRRRGVYVDAGTFARLKAGQTFDVGRAKGIDQHSRGPASAAQGEALEAGGKAILLEK